MELELGYLVYLNAKSKIIVRDYSHKIICKFHRLKDDWFAILNKKGICDAKVICYSISHNRLYITI